MLGEKKEGVVEGLGKRRVGSGKEQEEDEKEQKGFVKKGEVLEKKDQGFVEMEDDAGRKGQVFVAKVEGFGKKVLGPDQEMPQWLELKKQCCW